jgi:hypothetical protein
LLWWFPFNYIAIAFGIYRAKKYLKAKTDWILLIQKPGRKKQ